MQNALKASVVIPAWNAEETLGTTLAALTRQTLPASAFEVIVADDGSTDDTARTAKRFGVRLIQQENAGPAAARNAGAAVARGEILVFTDADCEPAEDWLERMTAPFADPEVSGAQGVYQTRQRGLAPRFAQAEFEDRYDLMRRAPSIDLVATYSAAFRRDVFLRMDGFNENFPAADNEDTEFSYRLAAAGHKLVLVPEAVVRHRHPATLRSYLRTKFGRAYWRVIVYRAYPDKALKDTYTPVVVKFQTLAGMATLGCLALGLFSSFFIRLGLLGLLGLAASSLPFARKAHARDPAVGLAAPWFVLLRSLVFAAGAACGLLACLGRGRTILEEK